MTVHHKNLNCLFAAAVDCRLTLSEEKSQICVTVLSMLRYKIFFNKVEPDPDQPSAAYKSEGAETHVWRLVYCFIILSGYLIFFSLLVPFCVQRLFPSREVLYLLLTSSSGH